MVGEVHSSPHLYLPEDDSRNVLVSADGTARSGRGNWPTVDIFESFLVTDLWPTNKTAGVCTSLQMGELPSPRSRYILQVAKPEGTDNN